MFSRVSSHVKEGIHQGRLEEVVRTLFHEEEKNIVSNARKEANVINPVTGRTLEIDVYLPSHHICFEFQDPYHYVSTWDSHAPLSSIQFSDDTKKEMIMTRGETIVLVPCWWDGLGESLAGSIKFQRPDLLPDAESCVPIPLNPPRGFFNLQGIPGVGELMLASFPQNQLEIFLTDENPWWVGEKYDGIRCCWNPVHKFLYGRSSVELDLPHVFARHFVPGFADMEIWFGRGMFQDSLKMLVQDSGDVDWSNLRFISFDLAGAYTEMQPFEERYQLLCSLIVPEHPFLILAFRLRCVASPALVHLSSMVIGEGGEGLILRKPKSPYIHGRSPFLLKYKAVQGDREALVVEKREEDKYLIKLPDGVTFVAPAGDLSPKEGEVVTFSYESSARREIPLGPRILRVRGDLTWEDVVRMDSAQGASQLSGSTAKSFGYAPKPTRYWTSEKGANMRTVFEAIAKNGNFDPLVAENWYEYTPADIVNMGGEQVIRNFKGSIFRALVDLFPEVHFDGNKFTNTPLKFWGNPSNRRKFLERFAEEKGFDPLLAENWYSVHIGEIDAFEKGGRTIVAAYNGNLSETLVHLFPEVHFDEKKFDMLPKNYWAKRENRRQFFLDVAKEKGFDPKDANNWYSLTKQTFCEEVSVKGGYSVMQHHRTVAGALVGLFPELKLEHTKFLTQPKKSIKNEPTRREIAESLAREHDQDPLSCKTWYNPSPGIFAGLKAICNTFYGGDFAAAIVALFPELDLDPARIPTLDQYHHHKIRTKFFAKFATEKNFDPLVAKNWYRISEEDIKKHQDGIRILKYYDNSLPRALANTFPKIGLNPFEFPNSTHLKNRRIFLEKFAESRHFDPLEAKNWRSINAQELLSQIGGRFLRDYYHGNLMKAVKHLFHDLDER
eukprot:Phypoly_transcript_01770.p1 GENE.Phypoly_transcript_01770~~Phypoly_transcript_01770.p1  ORF type:complete len:893 (+),score=154.72 Phypoly_transcript_01770:58-2736(+)